MRKEELNAYRNQRSHYRQVDEGSKWPSELVDIVKTNSKPVVEVCAAKHCLNCFKKEYAVCYKNYVRESIRGWSKKVSCLVAWCTYCPERSCSCTRLFMAKDISWLVGICQLARWCLQTWTTNAPYRHQFQTTPKSYKRGWHEGLKMACKWSNVLGL